MGVYCNKITRRARRISGRKVHTYTFAYRSGGSMFYEYPKGRTHDEHMHFKYVRPTEKAWADSGENIKDALFVAEYEDGAEVYRAYGVSFYDTGPGGEHVGHLRMEGTNGKLRIEFLEPVLWEVTFKGSKIHTGPNKGGTNPDRTVTVVAINPNRAKKAASEKLAEDVNVPAMSWTSMYPKIEKIVEEEPPKTNDELVDMIDKIALEFSSRTYDLSDRVAARKLIQQLRQNVNSDTRIGGE